MNEERQLFLSIVYFFFVGILVVSQDGDLLLELLNMTLMVLKHTAPRFICDQPSP